MAEQERESDAYTGRCKCGSLVAARVIDNSTVAFRRETASFVADLARDGLAIERHPVQYVREHLSLCTCEGRRERKSRAKQLDAFGGARA